MKKSDIDYQWGTIVRPVELKKQVRRSRFILNLTEEAKNWLKLNAILRVKIRKAGV